MSRLKIAVLGALVSVQLFAGWSAFAWAGSRGVFYMIGDELLGWVTLAIVAYLVESRRAARARSERASAALLTRLRQGQ